MNSSKGWLGIDAPAGWGEAFIRAVKAAVIAFVVLQLKEWFDAGKFDTPATALDATWIGAATFTLNVIHMWAKPGGSRDIGRLPTKGDRL